MRNKRGWIKILEAFIALLLIAGSILIVLPRAELTTAEKEKKIYEWETVVLREIELDEALRLEILKINLSINPNQEAPTEVLTKVNSSIPNYLQCELRVCAISDVCTLENYIKKEVYAEVVTISAISVTEQIYNPRKIKIFCWEK